MSITAPKGTKDILPADIENWHFIEKTAEETFTKANFKEIRTPIFEDTNLFERGVGDRREAHVGNVYSTACES